MCTKFEIHVVRGFEKKLRKLDVIKNVDVIPVLIDVTYDDNQKTIPCMFLEEEVGNNKNDVDFDDSFSDTINNADEILCKTYGSTEPPNSFKGQVCILVSVSYL